MLLRANYAIAVSYAHLHHQVTDWRQYQSLTGTQQKLHNTKWTSEQLCNSLSRLTI